MKKKVVYTCLVGNYDELLQPVVIHPDYDYICFSNDLPLIKQGVWTICRMPYVDADKTRQSRLVKICPHLVLNQYDCSLWIDANLVIQDSYIYDKIEQIESEKCVMAMVKHSARDCIYQDAIANLIYKRDSAKIILKQIWYLWRKGYPSHNGLFENNVIYRSHNVPIVIKISNEWWEIYTKFSKRDQLSLCYVLWNNNLTPALLLPEGYSAYNHNSFIFKFHPGNKYNLFQRIRIKLLSIVYKLWSGRSLYLIPLAVVSFFL